MRLLSFVFRLTAYAAGMLTSVAILIGRGDRESAGARQPENPRLRPISGHVLGDQVPGLGLGLLDVDTGALTRQHLPQADVLEHASSSPWRDARGRVHVVGLWRGGRGHEKLPMGLARYALPGGEAIDRVATDIVPSTPPCWFPDRSSRVLFTGRDGKLYRLAFDDALRDLPGGSEGGKAVPHRVDWGCARPGNGPVLISDPEWPAEPRFAGTILVALTMYGNDTPDQERERTRLWWLALDPEGTAIVAAGRLIAPAPPDALEAAIAKERHPAVAVLPDGGLALAYLARSEPDMTVCLRVARVDVDPSSGQPHVDPAESVELVRDCLVSPPMFSTDGRSVSVLMAGGPQNSARAVRFSVVEALQHQHRAGRTEEALSSR
jgi:hypothetical protein